MPSGMTPFPAVRLLMTTTPAPSFPAWKPWAEVAVQGRKKRRQTIWDVWASDGSRSYDAPAQQPFSSQRIPLRVSGETNSLTLTKQRPQAEAAGSIPAAPTEVYRRSVPTPWLFRRAYRGQAAMEPSRDTAERLFQAYT